jgi:hypothetical protein
MLCERFEKYRLLNSKRYDNFVAGIDAWHGVIANKLELCPGRAEEVGRCVDRVQGCCWMVYAIQFNDQIKSRRSMLQHLSIHFRIRQANWGQRPNRRACMEIGRGLRSGRVHECVYIVASYLNGKTVIF